MVVTVYGGAQGSPLIVVALVLTHQQTGISHVLTGCWAVGTHVK